MCQLKLKNLMLAAFFVCAVAAPSMADTFVLTGSTAPPSPTFRRPVETGDAFAVDGMGNPVFARYQTFGFTVSIAGAYNFLSTQNYDGFLILYGGVFNPANSLQNFLIGNDDLDFTPGLSGFDFTLAANTPYVLVTTGFDSTSFGNFVNVITGPGQVRPVPEPATLILLGTGLAGAVAARRRRRQMTEQS